MTDNYDIFDGIDIMPVIALEDASKAEKLAGALCEGGIYCAEVTFRTSCASQAIKSMIEACPNMLVGAGTVLNISQAEKALEAGAKFIVSPGFNSELVDWCIKNNVPTVPGVSNASEITAAINKGLTKVKLFPARTLGGCALLDDFKGPFPQVSFMPTGGISLENVRDYFKRKNVFCVGGTWMVKKELIGGEKWSEISEICKKSLELIRAD